MRYYCRFTFLPPLCLIALLSSIIYLISLIGHTIRLQNANFESFLIRNREEIRLAQIRTQMYHWSIAKDKLPFRYLPDKSALNPSNDPNRNYQRLTNPPGVTIAILTPNRSLKPNDIYETFYLTNSVASFMNATYHDLVMYGPRFRFINFTVCVTDDHPSQIKELVMVKQLLGPKQIISRPEAWNSKSLNCRTILDAGNCLFQSSTLSKNAYTILIEDDLIPDYRFFKHLWNIFVHSSDQEQARHDRPGLFQLYSPNSSIYFSPFDLTSMMELLIFSSFLTLLLMLAYLRVWWKPFSMVYNVILVTSTFCTSIFIICLIGRLKLLSLVHGTLNLCSVSLSTSPRAMSTGAAALLKSEQASKLGKLLMSVGCDSGAHIKLPLISKSSLIYDYLLSQNLSVWSVFPSLVKHIGLYSVYDDGLPNPFRVD